MCLCDGTARYSTVLHHGANWINVQTAQIPRERAKIPVIARYFISLLRVKLHPKVTYSRNILSIRLLCEHLFLSISFLFRLINLILILRWHRAV